MERRKADDRKWPTLKQANLANNSIINTTLLLIEQSFYLELIFDWSETISNAN